MNVIQIDKAERFGERHHRSKAFVIANPWDIGSTRILDGMGFQALATTSAGYAMSKGRLDGTFTREETLKYAGDIVAATELPVSADLENGFGASPETVAQTIQMAADIGLVGGSIDDATGRAEAPIYETSLAVERMAAAVEAARNFW